LFIYQHIVQIYREEEEEEEEMDRRDLLYSTCFPELKAGTTRFPHFLNNNLFTLSLYSP
jgi:hypothetical protein